MLLPLQLEAARKQQAYADRRYAHTEAWRRGYQAWQRAVTEQRLRLLGLLHSRAGMS